MIWILMKFHSQVCFHSPHGVHSPLNINSFTCKINQDNPTFNKDKVLCIVSQTNFLFFFSFFKFFSPMCHKNKFMNKSELRMKNILKLKQKTYSYKNFPMNENMGILIKVWGKVSLQLSLQRSLKTRNCREQTIWVFLTNSALIFIHLHFFLEYLQMTWFLLFIYKINGWKIIYNYT